MNFLKNKFLTFAVLALMFSVAVSGGCGGGGGGHYSGNFGDSGDSSQETTQETTPEDFTTEFVSSDVAPPISVEPALNEQFGSENADDDYGAGEINSLTLLNNTTWSIDKVEVSNYISQTKSYDVRVGNNYNINKITFVISGENEVYWATENAKKTLHYDYLTAEFYDKAWHDAPIFRPADSFLSRNDRYYQASFISNAQVGVEQIQMRERLTSTPSIAKKICIMNQFFAGNSSYKSHLYLSRVDNFSILDQTDWQIKNLKVVGFIKSGNKSEYSNPENYQVTKIGKVKKITLRTSFENNVGVLNFITDNKNKIASEPLIATFKDLTINRTLTAPFLRPASSFQINNEHPVEACEAFKADVNTGKYPGREFLYVSDYGPNGYLTLYNSIYYYDKNKKPYHYWAILVLEPYQSK